MQTRIWDWSENPFVSTPNVKAVSKAKGFGASLAARNKTDNEKAALDLRDALPVVGELADFVVEFGKARGT